MFVYIVASSRPGIKQSIYRAGHNCAPNGHYLHLFQLRHNSMHTRPDIPSSISKWNDIYQIDDNDWSSIFRVPFTCSKDTYLQTFQFCILHRIFPCNKWLYTLKVIDSELCEHCGIIDTIEHYLFSCDSNLDMQK